MKEGEEEDKEARKKIVCPFSSGDICREGREE